MEGCNQVSNPHIETSELSEAVGTSEAEEVVWSGVIDWEEKRIGDRFRSRHDWFVVPCNVTNYEFADYGCDAKTIVKSWPNRLSVKMLSPRFTDSEWLEQRMQNSQRLLFSFRFSHEQWGFEDAYAQTGCVGCVDLTGTSERPKEVMLLRFTEIENKKMLVGIIPTYFEAIEYLQFLCEQLKPNQVDIETEIVHPITTFHYFSIPKGHVVDWPEHTKCREQLKVEYLKNVNSNFVIAAAKVPNMTLVELQEAVKSETQFETKESIETAEELTQNDELTQLKNQLKQVTDERDAAITEINKWKNFLHFRERLNQKTICYLMNEPFVHETALTEVKNFVDPTNKMTLEYGQMLEENSSLRQLLRKLKDDLNETQKVLGLMTRKEAIAATMKSLIEHRKETWSSDFENSYSNQAISEPYPMVDQPPEHNDGDSASNETEQENTAENVPERSTSSCSLYNSDDSYVDNVPERSTSCSLYDSDDSYVFLEG